MKQNLGKNVSSVTGMDKQAISKIVFQKGRPPLDSELNQLQEVLIGLLKKSNFSKKSGWVSAETPFTDNSGKFFTHNPRYPVTEVAMVNGMPVVVAGNTKGFSGYGEFTNIIDMSTQPPPETGTRVDGVFLEVWRALVSDDYKNSPNSTVSSASLLSVDTIFVGGRQSTYQPNPKDLYPVYRSVMAGESGIIYVNMDSADPDSSWDQVPSPTDYRINAVSFIDSSTILIATEFGGIYRSNDLGSNWIKIDIGSSLDLNAISVSGQNIWIVGNSGLIVVSKDGGSTFAPFIGNGTAVNGADLGCVSFENENNGIVGGSGGYLAYFNGSDFIRSVVLTNGSRFTGKIKSIAHSNNLDIWAVGDNGKVFRSTDGGRFFNSIEASVPAGSTSLGSAIGGKSLNFVKVHKNSPSRIALVCNQQGVVRVDYEIQSDNIAFSWSVISNGIQYDGTSRVNWAAASSESGDLVTRLRALYVTVPGVSSSVNINLFSEVSFEWVPGTVAGYRGTIVPGSPGFITFSMNDIVVVGGESGVLFKSEDSGSSWFSDSSGDLWSSYDMYDYAFQGLDRARAVSSRLGSWYYSARKGDKPVGNEGSGPWYETSVGGGSYRTRKMYYEGNLESPASLHPIDDSISRVVGTETSIREQIQYRIRKVSNIDPTLYPDSGLGSPDIYALGPNSSPDLAGRGVYENMAASGDSGLYRSLCRGTTDGFSYAIPMFAILRRNTGTFNIQTNVSGSSGFRPDSIPSADVIQSADIVDCRKFVGDQSFDGLLDTAVDKLLNNQLSTYFSASQDGIANSGLRSDSFPYGSNRLSSFQNLLMLSSFSDSNNLGKIQLTSSTNGFSISLKTSTVPVKASFMPEKYSAMLLKAGLPVQPASGVFVGMGTDNIVFLTVRQLKEGSVQTDSVQDDFANSASSGTNRVIGSLSGYPNGSYVFDNQVNVLIMVQDNPVPFGLIKSGTRISIGSFETVTISDAIIREGKAVLNLSKPLSDSPELISGSAPVLIPTSGWVLTDENAPNRIYDTLSLDVPLVVSKTAGLSKSPTDIKALMVSTNTTVGSYSGLYRSVLSNDSGKVVRYSNNGRVIVSAPYSGSGSCMTIRYRGVLNSDGYVSIPISIDGFMPSMPVKAFFGGVVYPIRFGDGLTSFSETSGFKVFVGLPGSIPIGSLVEIELTSAVSDSIGPRKNNVDFSPEVAVFSPGSGSLIGLYSPQLVQSQPGSEMSVIISTSDLVSVGQSYLVSSQNTSPSVSVSAWFYVQQKGSWFLGKASMTISGTSVRVKDEGSIAGASLMLVPKLTVGPVVASDNTNVISVLYSTSESQSVNSSEKVSLEIVKAPYRGYVSNSGRGSGQSVSESGNYSNPIAQIPISSKSVTSESIFGNADVLSIGGNRIPSGFYTSTLRDYRSVSGYWDISGKTTDNFGRVMYSESSDNLVFSMEKCDYPTDRLMFVPVLARVVGNSTGLTHGEVVMVVVSAYLIGEENEIRVEPGSNFAISIYKLDRQVLI